MKHDIDKLLLNAYKKDDTIPDLKALNQTIIEKACVSEIGGKEKTVCRFKRISAFAAACFALIFLVGTSVFAVSAIRGNKWGTSVEFANGDTSEIASDVPYKIIPEDALISNDTVEMSLSEAEKILGFSLLDSDAALSDTVVYNTYVNKDGSLARVDIWRGNSISYGDGSLNLLAVILNEGADEEYILAVEEGIDAMGEKKFMQKIFSDSLNTYVIVYSAGAGDNNAGYITAQFVYDSVLYELSGEGITQEDIISAIETLR